MIKFTTSSGTPLQLLVNPRAIAYQVSQSDKYDIAEFLCEFAKDIVETRIKYDPNFQIDIAQYIEELTRSYQDLNNIEHYYGTLTDAIMYHSQVHKAWREDDDK